MATLHRMFALLILAPLMACSLIEVPPDLDPCAVAMKVGTLATDWNGYHFPPGRRHPRVVDMTNGVYSDILGPVIKSWNDLDSPANFSGESDWSIEVTVGKPEGALGVAEVSFDSNGHIVAGRVTMNPDAIERAHLGPNAPTHVLCQELGHELGLGHERAMLDTCMNDCVGLATRVEWVACLAHLEGRTPNDDDAALLRKKYPPNDDHGAGPGLTCQGRVVIHTFSEYGVPHGRH